MNQVLNIKMFAIAFIGYFRYDVGVQHVEPLLFFTNPVVI